MSLGTAITVSVLATLAVAAKNAAMAVAGNGTAGRRVHDTIEIAGALFILLIGILLFSAAVGA
jgi:ABC-type nickel/cobalt efflux system permease component RcnA